MDTEHPAVPPIYATATIRLPSAPSPPSQTWCCPRAGWWRLFCLDKEERKGLGPQGPPPGHACPKPLPCSEVGHNLVQPRRPPPPHTHTGLSRLYLLCARKEPVTGPSPVPHCQTQTPGSLTVWAAGSCSSSAGLFLFPGREEAAALLQTTCGQSPQPGAPPPLDCGCESSQHQTRQRKGAGGSWHLPARLRDAT